MYNSVVYLSQTRSFIMILRKAIYHLLKGKKKSLKLISPFLFFCLESALIVIFLWNMFGFHTVQHESASGFITKEPHVFVKLIHDFEHYEELVIAKENVPLFIRNNEVHVAHYVFQIISLFVAFLGVLIALLWIYRFFKRNDVNIEWWLWPAACCTAHIMFFFFACHF